MGAVAADTSREAHHGERAEQLDARAGGRDRAVSSGAAGALTTTVLIATSETFSLSNTRRPTV